MSEKKRVLFLCTGNSCRSQMAEGWARHLYGDRLEAHSAGVAPGQIDPRAVAVMAEAGVDIAAHTSKALDALPPGDFALVVTVCAHAHESCPVFSGNARVVHRGFDDPPRLAAKLLDEDMALEPYRRVRDEIRAFMRELPALLEA